MYYRLNQYWVDQGEEHIKIIQSEFYPLVNYKGGESPDLINAVTEVGPEEHVYSGGNMVLVATLKSDSHLIQRVII